MPSFLAGARLTAQSLNDVLTDSASDTQDTLGTTGSGTYTTTLSGGTACGVAFVAPISGIIQVSNDLFIQNSGTNASYCTIQVKTGSSIGSGSIILAAADVNSVVIDANTAGGQASIGRGYRLTGLTAGQAYNVQQLFRVNGSTGSFAWKRLSVFPIAA